MPENFVFAQLTDLIHPEQFRRCVQRYREMMQVKTFSCWNQFLCMAFGQLTFQEVCARWPLACAPASAVSLEDSRRGFPQRPGRRQPPTRLAHLRTIGQLLIRRARALYAAVHLGGDLKAAVYALGLGDDLCLSLFPWARFRARKAAIKLHTLLDLRGSIPAFIAISQGKQADVRVLDG